MTVAGVFTVSVPASGITFPCGRDEYVLGAMRRARAFPALWGCRGGGCGVCKVRVLSGRVRRESMSREHVSEAEAALGYALACRMKPESDLEIILV